MYEISKIIRLNCFTVPLPLWADYKQNKLCSPDANPSDGSLIGKTNDVSCFNDQSN